MRILVAGGAGFIGSHLTDRLLELGHEVLVVDNFYTGNRVNVGHHSNDLKFDILRHDVCLPLHVEVDFIFNLACPASPRNYQKDPIQTIKTSFLGSFNLLGLAKRLKVPILLSSTSEIYGDPLVHPQVESYWGNVNCIGPRSCYDEGKRAAETLFSDYRRQHGLDTKIVRIFNTYGPRMDVDDGRVVSNFIIQALKSEDVTIYGDGLQTRSFCYVSDLVEGLISMMGLPYKEGGPVNIGNPSEMTIKDIAEKVVEVTGTKSKIVYKELPQDDPKRRKPDISKAQNLLGWSPKVNLDTGLQHTVDYFRHKIGV